MFLARFGRFLPFVLLAAAVPCGAQNVAPAAAGLPVVAPEDVGLSSAALARIAPAFQPYVDSAKLGGVLVAVARQGRVAYLETFGYADVDAHVPLRDDAVFRIYSMTKPVTAVAVLKLVEQGRLALEDPVSRYIPSYGRVGVYTGGGVAAPATEPPQRPVTVQDLLAHTSGLSYGFGNSAVDSMVSAFGVFRATRTAAALADSLATLPLVHQPGERWRYGPGLEVAAGLVEVVTGEPFDVFVEREILCPLGMHESAFRHTPPLRQRLALPYVRRDGRLVAPPAELLIADMYEPDARLACGGCGLLSTAADFLRFAQMLLNRGELDGARVLGEASVRRMTSNVLPSIEGMSRAMGPGYGHGLGVAVQVGPPTAEHPTAPGTYGWAGGASTWFWVDPQNELILMVWAQHMPTGAYPLGAVLKPLVYGALVR